LNRSGPDNKLPTIVSNENFEPNGLMAGKAGNRLQQAKKEFQEKLL